jgi:uncharacterized protein YbaP (TraB family)
MWVWVFVFVYSSVLWSQRIDPSHQLLWQISGKGLKKPSYLFGSFHSNDHRLFDFTDSTYSAIIHADAIVLEADVYSMFTQFDSRVAETDLKFDSRGKPYTTDIRASRTKYGNEDGRPQFLDAYLQQIAFNSGKKFFALESVESQLALFDDISFQNYKAFNLKSLTYTQEGILQSYLHGNIDQMRAMLKSQLAISANAYNLLITDRNVKMTQKIEKMHKRIFSSTTLVYVNVFQRIAARCTQPVYTHMRTRILEPRVFMFVYVCMLCVCVHICEN